MVANARMAHSFVLRTRGFASQEGPGPRPQGGCPHEGAGTTLGRRRGLAAFRGPVSANARHVVSTGMRACMVWCNYVHHPRRDLSTVNRFPVTSDTPSGTSKRASSRTPIGRPQGSPGRRSCSRAPIPRAAQQGAPTPSVRRSRTPVRGTIKSARRPGGTFPTRQTGHVRKIGCRKS